MERIGVGDLVARRSAVVGDDRPGIVVDNRPSHPGLEASAHLSHILQVYRRVFYVLFPDSGVTGPFLENELILRQSADGARDHS